MNNTVTSLPIFSSLTSSQKQAVFSKKGMILVSAGAGSGKTKALSLRAYYLIKSGVKISSLLILTFTNKAAAEMKKRIRELVAKDSEISHLVGEIDSASITTFDSFYFSLLKKYHNELELSKNISIMDGSIEKALFKQYLNEIINKYVDEANPAIIKLIDDTAKKDPKKINGIISTIYKNLNNVNDLSLYINEFKNKFYNEEYFKKVFDSYFLNLKAKISIFDDKYLYNFESNEIKNNLLKFAQIAKHNDYDNFASDLLKFTSFKINEIKPTPIDEEKQFYKAFKDKVIELQKLIYLPTLEEIKNTYFDNFDVIYLMLNICKEIKEKIYKFQDENEIYSFSRIALKVLDLLNNDDIKNEIKNNFEYIMVDEYQDTSNIQDEFIRKIENNNVFMVGDIKQSIYKFREANPKLFMDKFSTYSKNNLLGNLIVFPNNFRSSPKLLKDFNDMFSILMSDTLGDASYKDDHIIIETNPNFDNVDISNHGIKFLSFDKDDENFKAQKIQENEIRIVISKIIENINKDIELLKNKYNDEEEFKKALNESKFYDDHVILVRSRNNYETYKKIFEEYKLPVSFDNPENAITTEIIIFYQNIFKLLINNKESDVYKFSLMSLGRNFIIKESDYNLDEAFKNNDFDSLEFVIKINEIKNKYSNLRLSEIVDIINDSFDVFNKLKDSIGVSSNLDKLSSIYDLANNMDLLNYSPSDFVEYLDILQEEKEKLELSEPKEANNTIRIMTIHSSKGLEFKNVYCINLSGDFNTKDFSSNTSFNYKHGFALGKNGEHSFMNQYLENEELPLTKSEELRLLYVAITRAISTCYIVYQNSSKINNPLSYDELSSIHSFLYMLPNKFINDHLETFSLEHKEISINENKIYQYNPDLKQIKDIEKIEIIKNRLTKEDVVNIDSSILEKGTRLHYLLEIVDFVTKDLSFVKDETDKNMLENFLQIEIFNFTKEDKIYHEYQFYDEVNNVSGVIDLLVIKDNEVMIIDYKTNNIYDDAYDKQLNGYRKYIEQKFNKNIKMYLCSIVKGKYREVKICD